jgi:hypothetical protein
MDFGCPILAAFLFLRLGWDKKSQFGEIDERDHGK